MSMLMPESYEGPCRDCGELAKGYWLCNECYEAMSPKPSSPLVDAKVDHVTSRRCNNLHPGDPGYEYEDHYGHEE